MTLYYYGIAADEVTAELLSGLGHSSGQARVSDNGNIAIISTTDAEYSTEGLTVSWGPYTAAQARTYLANNADDWDGA